MRSWTTILVILYVAWAADSRSLNSSLPFISPTGKLFNQISIDLAPYTAGINRAMVDKVYCSTAPGFRVQIKDQEVYIAGEVRGFQSRNRNIKLALLELASQVTDLPDVDLVLGTDDFTADGAGHAGPILAQVWH